MFLILDIGCGATPRGNVNIDPFPFDRKQCYAEWDPRDIPVFILADAESLPFRSKQFEKVLCIHALEHFKNPLTALREIKRVVTKEVLFKVPSQFNIGKTETHFFTWNPETLENLLRLIFENVETGYTARINFMDENYIIMRVFPFLNSLLPKLGLYPEIYARIKIEAS